MKDIKCIHPCSKTPIYLFLLYLLLRKERKLIAIKRKSRISEREGPLGGPAACSPGKFWKNRKWKPDIFSVNLRMPSGKRKTWETEHRRHLKRGKWGGEVLIKIIVVGTAKEVRTPWAPSGFALGSTSIQVARKILSKIRQQTCIIAMLPTFFPPVNRILELKIRIHAPRFFPPQKVAFLHIRVLTHFPSTFYT